ncbi:transposase [Corynebacterium accolens]
MSTARFIRLGRTPIRLYGTPRITAELTERYHIVLNRKTVAKRMRMMGIKRDFTAGLCPSDNGPSQA